MVWMFFPNRVYSIGFSWRLKEGIHRNTCKPAGSQGHHGPVAEVAVSIFTRFFYKDLP